MQDPADYPVSANQTDPPFDDMSHAEDEGTAANTSATDGTQDSTAGDEQEESVQQQDHLDEKLEGTRDGVNLLLYFICSIWICIAYVGYTLVERSATRPHNSLFVLFRNTVNMCVAYFIFYLIGFGISQEAAGGVVGNGKAYGQDFESLDYTLWIISFGLCLISVQV